MADNKTGDWVAPRTAGETYVHLSGNKFSGLNRDSAGPRTEQDLPRGNKEFQLYSLNTPNGQKVGIALEELGLEYDAHLIHILEGAQFTSGFVKLNPNSRIPALRHYQGDGRGEVVDVFESGAILLYLAERYNRFLPPPGKERAELYSWLMWEMGSQGPMFGQFGHFFRYAPRDKHEAINYGVARYSMEVKRLLSVMENHLAQPNKAWFIGSEYTIADMALYPWVRALGKAGYGAWEFLQVDETYPKVVQWCGRMEQRSAVQFGMLVCGPPGATAKLVKLRAELRAGF
ncbi:hypothetical protein BASA81_001812 [Batrachochytrium salamandrivorans]|nr:hypothetical protein BASA81_001812 [Batrachochytrium salamandrivorans]